MSSTLDTSTLRYILCYPRRDKTILRINIFKEQAFSSFWTHQARYTSCESSGDAMITRPGSFWESRILITSVHEIADDIVGSVRNGHHVLGQFRVEHGYDFVEVSQAMSQDHRDGERCRSVDLDDLASGEFAVGNHLVQALFGVLHDLVVLRRSAERDFQDSVHEGDVVGFHCVSPFCAGLVTSWFGFLYIAPLLSVGEYKNKFMLRSYSPTDRTLVIFKELLN